MFVLQNGTRLASAPTSSIRTLHEGPGLATCSNSAVPPPMFFHCIQSNQLPKCCESGLRKYLPGNCPQRQHCNANSKIWRDAVVFKFRLHDLDAPARSIPSWVMLTHKDSAESQIAEATAGFCKVAQRRLRALFRRTKLPAPSSQLAADEPAANCCLELHKMQGQGRSGSRCHQPHLQIWPGVFGHCWHVARWRLPQHKKTTN